MLINFIKKIPYIIPAFVIINIIIIKVFEANNFVLFNGIISLQFNPKMPFYLNYWLIYMTIAIITSIVFAVTKKYTIGETTLTISINLILSIILLIFIINRM